MQNSARYAGPIRHIIWDWNGTLYNDAEACVATLNVILERRGLALVDIDQYRAVFRFPVKEYYEALGFDFTIEEWDAMAKEFHTIYREESGRMKLRDGIESLLSRCKADGILMSVLSASETETLEKLLSDYGIRGYFQRVRGLSDIYAGSKIDAGRKLMEEISSYAGKILLVGDTTHDYEVACEIDCACALLCEGHQARHRLEKCGCPVYGCLEEFAESLLP